MSKAGKMHGTPVSHGEVAEGLGFSSVEEFRAWLAAGSPTGECSNDYCARPAFYPHLDQPCKYCGSPIKLDKPVQKSQDQDNEHSHQV